MSQTKAQLIDTLVASLLPASDSSVDIGSNAVRFANIYGDTLYGDGSNLTGITSTTINSNADNRLITGSGSANTLNGESGLTFDGTTLDLTATSGKITINSTGPAVQFIDTNADSDFMAQADGGVFKLVDLTNSNATRLVLNSSGKVGINETNPSEMLHIKAEDNTDSFGGLIIKANNNSVHMKYGWRGLDANSGGDIRFAVGGTEMMRVLSSGKVGLGRTSADEMLHILNDDNTDGFGGIKIDSNNGSINCKYGWLGVDGSNSFRIGVAGTERMRVTDAGKVGIGTTSPTQTLDVTASNSVGIAQFTNTESSFSNDCYTVHIDSSAHTSNMTSAGAFAVDVNAGRAMTINGNGDVGIGTSSPTDKLHVVGDVEFTLGTDVFDVMTTGSGSKHPIRLLNADASAGNQVGIQFGPANNVVGASIQGIAESDFTSSANRDGALGFTTRLNGTLSEAMRIDSSGRVGIGTTSPSDKLHVRGASAAFTAFILDNATNSSSPYKITYGDQGQVNHLAVANREMTFGTNNTERMRIKSDGDIQLTRATAGGGNETLLITANYGAGSDQALQASNSLRFYSGGANERVRIASNGRVGIGITSPETLQHNRVNTFSDDINKVALTLSNNQSSGVHQYFQNGSTGTGVSNGARIGLGNTDNFLIQHFEAKDIQISTNSTERMRINSSGNVGIGSSNPQYKLHVLAGIVDQTARFENSKTSDNDINYIGVGLASGTTGSALFGHTGHSTAGSQAAWMGLGGDDVAGGVGVKCFKGGAVQMNGTLRVGTGTQYGRIHSIANGFNPGNSNWLTGAAYIASSSFGGGYGLLDGSKGYSMYCAGNGANFFIQHHTSTTAGATGGVTITNGATSWTSASDERDKENLVTISDAITKIKTLRTVTGNYTWQSDVKHAFLIAQDVQSVLPEAVDIINEHEETENQRLGLRYTEVIPLLTAALKEAIAEIDTLKTKVAALEAA